MRELLTSLCFPLQPLQSLRSKTPIFIAKDFLEQHYAVILVTASWSISDFRV